MYRYKKLMVCLNLDEHDRYLVKYSGFISRMTKSEKDKNVVSSIRKFSESLGAALIVVGARGRSGNIAALLLGSITEGLIRTTQKPLLAVKEKGQGLNILEAFTSE